MLLQLTNVGATTIVVKDPDGYTDFVTSVDPATTVTVEVSQDLLQRLTDLLTTMETPVLDEQGAVQTALRWSVVAGSDDIRASRAELAGLPSLNELQAASYSTGSGATDVVATGSNLLGGQVRASKDFTEGTATLDVEAVVPGAPGNALSLEVVAGSGALSVAVTGNKITVTLASGGSTVSAVAGALNGDSDVKLLVQATVGAAGSLTQAVDETLLSGGKGPGVSLALNGTALALSEVTDSQLTFDLPSGISAASRIVPLEYQNGPHKSRLSVPVVA